MFSSLILSIVMLALSICTPISQPTEYMLYFKADSLTTTQFITDGSDTLALVVDSTDITIYTEEALHALRDLEEVTLTEETSEGLYKGRQVTLMDYPTKD